INYSHLQMQLLLLAITIYSIWGQPTPESLGVVEVVIAILLVISIGALNFLGVLTLRPLFEKKREAFEKVGSVALSFLFIIPFVNGLIRGHSLSLIIRDAIPLLYSFIPVFMCSKISNRDTSRLYLVGVFAGVCLALRFLIISGFSWELLGEFGFYDNNMYLAISPFILFATLFMFLDFFEVKSLIKKGLTIFYSTICFGAMMATSQRASIGSAVVFSSLYVVNKSRKNILYVISALGMFALMYFYFGEYIDTSLNMLIEKTRAVGSNSRIEEFYAVISEIKNSVADILFGKGWGYKFQSPAIVDTKVGFTHCMFTYFVLKTGLLGTFLYSSYLALIFIKVFTNNKNINFISYSCLAPILISMTLYTGYKYFDFGCLLLIMLSTKIIPSTVSQKRQDIINKFNEAKIDNPVLDSSIIMQKALGISKTMLFVDGARALSHRDELAINKLVKRRLKNEPIARIEKSKEFWGLEFVLNKNTLVPRPDSESVVESILENFDANDELRVLDLGTGSGCLLLSILHEFKNSTGVGVDLSAGALRQARQNANSLKLKDRCKFIKSNWFDNVHGEFDIIISNPPYVKKDEKLSKEVYNYDPHLALFAENEGLNCYEEISKEVCKYMKPQGKLFLEIGVGQKTKVSCFMKKAGLRYLGQKKDLRGKIRCIVFQKP
ncbi:MAG: peptide chain release factor N(5)-glutamine methyltransferase, partial [Alphaproteobacteria bacterium]|nr:peptide chain release factor N(5)-glutamine methyltransferase [Alphaproteobacteria bacterium]